MKKKKKTSIQNKVLFYLLTFDIVILILLWICEITVFNYYYEKSQIEAIDNMVSRIEIEKPRNVSDLLKEIVYNQDVCIAVTDNKGFIARYNNQMPNCGFNHKNDKMEELINSFINSKKIKKSYIFKNDDFDVKALLYGLKYDDDINIFLYSNLKDLSNVTIIIKQQIMYIFLLGIIVAGIITIFLANKITDPITKITKKAKKLGNGEYDIKFDESDIKEIDELSKTLTQAKEELAQTDELRRDLMANVSHDLKTPLTMIKAYAEMIKDISYKDYDKMNNHLDIIVDETDRLTLLVNDILELSKMQSHATELNIEEFDLVSLINTIIKRYEIIKETEQYNIKVDMPDELIIKADRKKIEQVIYNLVNNAINYTGDDKTVYITISKVKRSYLVEIRDTGKGIKEEEIPHIWEKYYKNNKKHQRNVVSTGLGLSIVKQILELHKYEYGVKSKENMGTTFYFKIR